MAHSKTTLETINTPAGTVRVVCYHPSAITFPAGGVVTSLGDFSERIDEAAGVIDFGGVTVEAIEDYTNYAEGFWVRLFGQSGAIYFRFDLDEGSGYKYLFAGKVDKAGVAFEEYFGTDAGDGAYTSVRRRVSFDCVGLLTALKEKTCTDYASYVGALSEEASLLGIPTSPTITINNLNSPEIDRYEYTILFYAKNSYGELVAVTEENGSPVEHTVICQVGYNGTEEIELNWSAVTGASGYVIVIYRDDGGTWGRCDQVGNVTTHTISNENYFTSQSSQIFPTQHRIRAISIKNLIGRSFEYGFADLQSGSSNYFTVGAIAENQPVKYYGNGTALAADQAFIIAKNRSTQSDIFSAITTSPYFDSQNALFLGAVFRNLFEFLDAMAKQFGYVFTVGYDYVNEKFTVTALARRQEYSGATVTFEHGLISSDFMPESFIKAETFKSTCKGTETITFEILPYMSTGIDIEVDAHFVIDSSAAWYEKIYYFGATTVTACEKCKYYDAQADGYSADKTSTVEAICRYYDRMYNSGRKSYSRTYYTLRADDGSTDAQTNIGVLRRTIINTGNGVSVTFYANEVRKNVMTNEMTIQWIEE